MQRVLSVLFIGIIVSFYFFTFSFKFLPPSLNTKVILALVGLTIFLLRSAANHSFNFSKELLFGTIIAITFSVLCFISADINHTNDYTYASYIFTFFVWIFSAYTVAYFVYQKHGAFTIPLLTKYLAGVSSFQCIAALTIDNSTPVRNAVNSVVEQSADFVESINRLYGVGANLDPAGVRFAIVLILIVFVLIKDEKERRNTRTLIFLILSFLMISVVGNMISRTTTTGMVIGGASAFLLSGGNKLSLKYSNIKTTAIILGIVALFTAVVIYLYNTNPYYYDQLRFGFEGFFNWMESGEWRTDSTDKLQTVMWVWPTDLNTWIIGSGLFGNFAFSTDIGYCRFVLYCGLVGFSTFVFFFLYNTLTFAKKYPKYKVLFFALFGLGLVIWLKVATDVFIIFALFYWLTDNNRSTDNTELSENDVISNQLQR